MSLLRKKAPPARPAILHDVVQQVWNEVWARGGGEGGNNGGNTGDDNDDNDAKGILIATKEALRVLKLRAPPGNLGQGDREKVRAALFLNHFIRKQQQQQKQQQQASCKTRVALIPLKDMAKKLGISFVHLREMDTKIGHYFYEMQPPQQACGKRPSSAVAVVSLNGKKRRTSNGQSLTIMSQQQQSQGRYPRRTCTLDHESLMEHDNIVPELAIRLSSYLPDPSRVLQATLTALNEYVLQFLTTKKKSVGEEHDLGRYWPAYQAAMFYHIAVTTTATCSQEAGVAALTTSTTTTTTKRTKRTTTHKDHENEEDMQVLSLERLVEASPMFTYLEVKEKVPIVKKWYEETAKQKKEHEEKKKKREEEEETKKKSSKHSVGPKQGAKPQPTQKLPSTTTTPIYKNQQNASMTLSEKFVHQQEIIHLLDNNGSSNNNNDSNSNHPGMTSFATWKASILDMACVRACPNDPADKAGSTNGNLDALQAAANDVLAKYNLL